MYSCDGKAVVPPNAFVEMATFLNYFKNSIVQHRLKNSIYLKYKSFKLWHLWISDLFNASSLNISNN